MLVIPAIIPAWNRRLEKWKIEKSGGRDAGQSRMAISLAFYILISAADNERS